MKHFILVFLFSVSLFFTQGLNAETEPVNASLISESESIQPNTPFWVVTRLKLQDHWHAYWKNPGDSGMAPSIKWTLPAGFSAEETQFPYPKRFTSNELVGFGYEDEVLLLTKIIPAKNIAAEKIDLSAEVNWVVCSKDTCLPGDANLSVSMPVKPETPEAGSNAPIFAKARAKLPQEAPKISAEQLKDSIALTIPHKDQAITATFFPEADQNLDIKGEASTKPHPDLPNHHVVALPTISGQESSQLKGVLVTQGKGEPEAFAVNIPVVKPAAAAPVPMEFEGGFALAILFAFIGGMILNLMPCVLPVMSFKVLGFVKMAGQSRSLTLKHGLLFSLGVLASFWALAALLLALQSYGRAVGWGFQLQEPLFVASLATVLLVFGLSLFGVFELGTSIASRAGQAQTATRSGYSELFGSFMSGVLATAVATPCTGPFLGSALGYAVTQPPFFSMLIFTSIGSGMAFPYLLLAGNPKLLRFMPKPGAWMETFKEMMGFLMLASVLWLIWVFSAQTNYMAVTMLLGGFFVLAIGCWIYGKWATPLKSKFTRTVGTVITAVFFIIGADIIYTSTTPWVEEMGGISANSSHPGDGWEDFSQARIDELQKQGIPVFVDFTAKWCLICQTNHMALSTNSVAQEFTKKGVVKMKADWTKRNAEITEALRKFGRNGVPLYVFYPGDSKQAPEILPQVLTPDIIISAIQKDNVAVATHK